MADPRAEVHALLRGLVNRHFEKQSSAAKEMGDHWSPTGNCGDDYDTSDLSRKMNGSRQWTVSDVMALEAITGSSRVTDRMRNNRQAAPPSDALSTLQHCKRLLRESNEGISALMAVEEGGCKEQARAELIDILEVVQAALKFLEAQT